VIRKMLRWTPDAVAYFDYASSPPTLHIRRRASLTAQAVDLAAGAVESVRLAPRHDLRRSVVVLKYERTDTVDGDDFTGAAQPRCRRKRTAVRTKNVPLPAICRVGVLRLVRKWCPLLQGIRVPLEGIFSCRLYGRVG
ncbi:MAG: hypothetical protein AAGD40_06170, partial [Pseudomonadota bacterium]